MNKKSLRNVVLGAFFPLLIGGFFYLLNQKNRKPLYTAKDKPTLIFDKESSSNKIKLVKYDSIQVKENVYCTRLILWNDGDLTISKEDVRENFYISIIGEGSIIESKIINETDKGVSKFRLINTNDKIKIDWDHFDPDSGVELQFLYSGNKSTYIEISGKVLGNNLRKVHNRNTLSFGDVLYVIGIFVLEIIFFLTIGFYDFDYKVPFERGLGIFTNAVLLLTVIGGIIYIFIKAWGYRPPL